MRRSQRIRYGFYHIQGKFRATRAFENLLCPNLALSKTQDECGFQPFQGIEGKIRTVFIIYIIYNLLFFNIFNKSMKLRPECPKHKNIQIPCGFEVRARSGQMYSWLALAALGLP